jgi:hypothetical protein
VAEALMRGFRSTLVLLAILIGLVAYIYFVESRKTTTPAGEEAKQKVFSVAADTIVELSVKPASGEETVLKKADGSWQIVQPVQAAADQAEVLGLTTNLATLEIQRVVDENAGDLKQYGLAEPRVDVGFKATGDRDFHHLLIGDKTATGGDLYARLQNQKNVFLVSAFLESTFNRSTFDLRDKAVLTFDRNKVDSVALASLDKKVELAKSGEDWSLTRPIEARADFGTVEGLIGRLQTAQMKSLVTTEAKDLEEYGLDKPDLSATIGAGSARATLQIGKKAPDGTLYARDASRPLVFTIEAGLVDELKKPSDDYRRKDVFEFRPYNASRLEITRGTDTLVFEKANASGKDATEKWRQVSPAAREVDGPMMDEFLTKLTNLRTQSWAAASTKTGLDKPVLTASARFDDGKKLERVAFGKAGPDVYASRTGEAGAAKLDSVEFDAVMKALDALK